MFVNVIKAYYICEDWVKMRSSSMKMEGTFDLEHSNTPE